VLIGGHTFSGGEEFCYNLQALAGRDLTRLRVRA
jgi:hypothetical protein